jgi:hypothetical protein
VHRFLAASLAGFSTACTLLSGWSELQDAPTETPRDATAEARPVGDEPVDGSSVDGGPISEVWDAVDYLPWDYPPEGSFARSYYVAMEFASRDVPISQEIVSVAWMQNNTRLEPIDATKAGNPPASFRGNAVKWNFHVAVLLLPPIVEEPTIFDPLLEKGPVPVGVWVGHVNGGGQPKSQLGANNEPTLGFNEFSTAGSTYVNVEPDLGKWWTSVTTPTMSSLLSSPFKAAHVKLACDAIWTMYDCLGNAPEPRRAALAKRTNQLAAALQTKGLIAGWDTQAIDCASTNLDCNL